MLETLLASYQKQYAYYRFLGEGAVIVKHLSGNMKSRWTDFLTTDGEKPWRNRDDEFIADFRDRSELETAWNEGWSVVEKALNGLDPEQLEQIMHYAYHMGQIIMLGKQVKGHEWRSLSIPRGDSKSFNAGKFAEDKGVRNFIDGLMKDKGK